MAEIVICPSCQRKLQVPETLLGQDVQCPSCSATFLAQDSGGGAPPLPPVSAAPPSSAAPPIPEPRPLDRPRRDWGDDDRYDDEFDERRVRRRRRDVEPHRGTVVLVLGILSIVLGGTGLGVILGPIAWVMGNNDMKGIRADRIDPQGEGIVNAGRICGIIGTIMSACLVIFFCLYFVCVFSFIGLASKGGKF